MGKKRTSAGTNLRAPFGFFVVFLGASSPRTLPLTLFLENLHALQGSVIQVYTIFRNSKPWKITENSSEQKRINRLKVPVSHRKWNVPLLSSMRENLFHKS